MKLDSQPGFATIDKILGGIGQTLKLSRMRQKLSMEKLAKITNISRPTLWQMEKGSAKVAIGTYVKVLLVLKLEKEILFAQ